MATKSGRATVKDVRQGKTFWEVWAIVKSDGSVQFSSIAMVQALSRPFQEAVDVLLRTAGYDARQLTAVSYQVADKQGRWVSPLANSYAWALGLEPYPFHCDPEPFMGGWFVTRAAAQRWVDSMRNYVPSRDQIFDAYDSEQVHADGTERLEETMGLLDDAIQPTPVESVVDRTYEGANTLGELLRRRQAKLDAEVLALKTQEEKAQ